jgi:hypothetical protein
VNITTLPTTTRSATTRRTAYTLVLAAAAAAVAAVCVAAPAQSAAASPKPQTPSVAHTRHHASTPGCADQLRDLTVHLRDIGFTGQASHIAAQLTLGC